MLVITVVLDGIEENPQSEATFTELVNAFVTQGECALLPGIRVADVDIGNRLGIPLTKPVLQCERCATHLLVQELEHGT